MIHDVVMAVVLKICSIFIFIFKIIIIMIFMIVSKKMVLHCTLARLVGLKRVGKIVLEYSAIFSHEYSSTHLLGIH